MWAIRSAIRSRSCRPGGTQVSMMASRNAAPKSIGWRWGASPPPTHRHASHTNTRDPRNAAKRCSRTRSVQDSLLDMLDTMHAMNTTRAIASKA
jgi:hypothetical protein